MSEKELTIQIDELHNQANQALRSKNIDSYLDSFSNNLQYKQLNGSIINKKQLAKDTRIYFNRIKRFSSAYKRKEFMIIDEDTITEKLIQNVTVSIKVFVFFSKNWTIEREGIYEWKKQNNLWKIISVKIINETIN